MKRLLSALAACAALVCAQTAQFPGALATDSQLKTQSNRAQTTLSVTFAAADTVLVVANGSKFVAPSIITVDDKAGTSEIVAICAVSQNTLSVGASTGSCPNINGRAYDGSSAISHPSGGTVSAFITAWHHNAVKEEIKAIEASLGANLSNVVTAGGNNPFSGTNTFSGTSTFTGPLQASGSSKTAPNRIGAVDPLTCDAAVAETFFNTTTKKLKLCSSPNTWTTPASSSVADYDFAAQTPGGSLTGGAVATVTLTPCPLGAAGAHANHYYYLSGGTGTAEAALSTGGTCTSGAATGTITFTPANSHSGAWTIRSATAGMQEALFAAGAGGSAYVPAGAYTFYGQLTIPYSSQSLTGAGRDLVTIQAAANTNLDQMIFVTGVSNTLIEGLALDGNFINQSAGVGHGISLYAARATTIRGNKLTHFGVNPDPTTAAAAVMNNGSSNTRILENLFTSNRGYDTYNAYGAVDQNDGLVISHNQFGEPLVTDSATNVNWWDTHSAGFLSVSLVGKGCEAHGNRIYGHSRRATAGSFIRFNPLRLDHGVNCSVAGNVINGLSNGFGTVSVTNGSATVTGVNTHFSTTAAPSVYSDVNSFLKLEGDATLYRITAIASTNSVTVTPVVARSSASGLRYQINTPGDMFSVTDTLNSTVHGNTIQYGHDTGLQIGSGNGTTNTVQGVVFSGNSSQYNWNGGFSCALGCDNLTIVGNNFSNNGQGLTATADIYRVGLLIGASGNTLYTWFRNSTIAGNSLNDVQTTATQQYGMVIDTLNVRNNVLGANEIRGNGITPFGLSGSATVDTAFSDSPAYPTWIGGNYRVAGSSFDPSSSIGALTVHGGDQNGYVGFGYNAATNYGWVQAGKSGVGYMPLYLNRAGSHVVLPSVPFASLGGGVAGAMQYCNNCTTAAICVAGGSGHMAVSNGASWTCQ